MNREIKFRAWLPEFKKMETDLFGLRSDGMTSFNSNAILQQFTDLKDSNGKTYCQDDIVLYEGKNYRLIRGAYKFELVGFYSSSQDEPSDFFSEGAYTLAEIVGNIYETPELLAK